MNRKAILPVVAMFLALTGCSGGKPSQLEVSRSEGISYMKQAQYESAIDSFETAYALCDEKMPATKTDISLYEAACKMKLEDYEGVKSICSRILELNDSAEAFFMRGAAFLNEGDQDAAKADFDRAAELNPTDYQMLLNIYKQYEAISKSAVGDTYIQKALENPGTDLEDDYQKGCIYFYLKDYTKALEALAKPVEDNMKKAILLMGETYLAQGDNTHARNIFQKYLEEFGNTATAYNGLALCDLADRAYTAAITDIESGLALEPDDETKRELLFNEVVAYENQRDFETAKSKIQTFVELYPEDEDGQREYQFLITR